MISHFDDFCLWVYVLVDDKCKEPELTITVLSIGARKGRVTLGRKQVFKSPFSRSAAART